MWKFNNGLVLLLLLTLLAFGCRNRTRSEYTRHKLGYYYKLLAFSTQTSATKPKNRAWLYASFSNQMDSVFWDSYNNMNDAFVLKLDIADNSFLQTQVLNSNTGDSLCLLIPVIPFFKQQFDSDKVPFFSVKDSVVKVRIRIKAFMDESDYQQCLSGFRLREEQQIRAFFGSEQAYRQARDSSGFFWVQPSGATVKRILHYQDNIYLSYEGSFLNGRFLEKSVPGFSFQFGVPDQVLKGINNVIRYLREGENVKIILPSPLAFGEPGSSNGTVPPFTPLLYNIKLIQVKAQ